MSLPEIGFLAFGIILGTTAGAAFLTVVRPRSPLRPVVRVTVTPNAMAPRAGGRQPFAQTVHVGAPTPGSPDEEARLDMADGLPSAPPPAVAAPAYRLSATRTRVPSSPASLPVDAVGIPIVGAGQPMPGAVAFAAGAATSTAVALAERPPADSAADVRHDLRADLPTSIDIGASRPDLVVRPRPPAAVPRPSLSAAPAGTAVIAGAEPTAEPADRSPVAPVPLAAPVTADPCADDRAAATTQCRTAHTTREAARLAADRLREAQRAHTSLDADVDEARALADPRRLAAEKDRLHAAFTAAHGTSGSPDDAEAAAREWLTAVSTANVAARAAALRVQKGTAELRAQAADLERLDLEADAARITTQRAEAACRAARETLATCEERQRSVAATPAGGPGPLVGHWPGSPEPAFDRKPGDPVDDGRLPVIVRVLRGDSAARERLVAELAAGDAAAIAAWHVRIARFVDAVTARAIEDGDLDVPDDHAFWRMFDVDERRDIILALASLGFRFDGLRGFADERVPSARDLSLAVGYAGMDRMRVRVWPGETELAVLFDGATVRADAWLVGQADDLSLARIEAALGPQADAMGDLWDAWARVRPAMLADS